MKRIQIFLLVVAFIGVLGGFWLLPIRGQVIVAPTGSPDALVFPQIRVESNAQETDVYLTDNRAWSSVGLTINGNLTRPLDWRENPGGTVTWHWAFAPNLLNGTIFFYRDCHTGCLERAHFVFGSNETNPIQQPIPTKLCVVSANPRRDWHGRSGWNVLVTFATLAEDKARGIDELAKQVYDASRQNLRTLVRVDFAPGQTLPPAGNNVALNQYLNYVRRLVRDERLHSVYGYVIGSGFNDSASNLLVPNSPPLSPQWYARVFSGYGENVNRTDNAVHVVRQENSLARVLVGPVRPFKTEQDGARKYRIDAPWLNYMNTLVALLDETARAKTEAGFALTAPDGFAVNAFGRTNARELNRRAASEEPRADLLRKEWNSAQAGFRIYRDWLDIINAYPTTRGLPIFISATNTFTPDEGIPPAQNYPRGWLTNAYEVINAEPQVQALCWFLDHDESPDGRWDGYSLTKAVGRVYDAAQEFDELLKK